MQKESTNLDQRFERYNLRKFEFKFEQIKFKQFKNVKFWFYNILMVTMSTQEKELMNLDIRISRYT